MNDYRMNEPDCASATEKIYYLHVLDLVLVLVVLDLATSISIY